MNAEALLRQSLNRLAKWRTVFAGWQLGTRAKGDPECDAVRDHREVTILMRAEMNTLVELLMEKKVFTHEEFQLSLGENADHMSAQYERQFPGFKAQDYGMEMKMPEAGETMKDWRP